MPNSPEREDFLVASDVRRRFGTTVALDGATVAVGRGESLALLGPSGCGKTTLLRVVAGLERPDSGTVTVDGDVLTGPGRDVPAERRRVGMVFQDAALFPHLTVERNVAYGLGRAELGAGRVQETLELVDLAHLAHRRPHELSGGQAQRVALARALAPRPRVLLFDEPFTGLDSALRVRVRTEIHALLRAVGVTSVFVTHDQEEAFVLGDRVAVMREGRVRQVGTPAEVYASPVDPWVARFVGEANLLPATLHADLAATPLGDIPVRAEAAGATATGTGRQVLVRPEHLDLEPDGPAVVTDVAFYGHDCSYSVRLGDLDLLVRAAAGPRFGVGDRVGVRFAGPRTTSYPDVPAGVAATPVPA
ncbi:ABC transporter ATP-binding protein [Aquipuribacter nitratireducens]|uniref:ABC transporter ATP-binding protein n=1 Tax=Aquipuribacter nitratireducens TaxID=650104 RepID=A0ABW0GLF5_9MICO